MTTYAEYRAKNSATYISFDREREETIAGWYVAPLTFCPHVASVLDESNWATLQTMLDHAGVEYQVLSFGHWATPYDLIVVEPTAEAEALLDLIERDLNNYPVLDEDDLGEREQTAAAVLWKECYSTSDRIAYMRRHASDFECHSFADMLGCARGKYFAGIAGDLVNS